MKVSKELFQELSQISADAGAPGMFSKEDILKARVKEIADYFRDNGKYPSVKDENPHVRTLGRWLGKMRKSHKNGEF